MSAWVQPLVTLGYCIVIVTFNVLLQKVLRRLERVERAVAVMHAFRVLEIAQTMKAAEQPCPDCKGSETHTEECFVLRMRDVVTKAMAEAQEEAKKEKQK